MGKDSVRFLLKIQQDSQYLMQFFLKQQQKLPVDGEKQWSW